LNGNERTGARGLKRFELEAIPSDPGADVLAITVLGILGTRLNSSGLSV